MDSESAVCSKVDGVLEKLGVRRLVMGHTPHFSGIVSRCNGKILVIDTGMLSMNPLNQLLMLR